MLAPLLAAKVHLAAPWAARQGDSGRTNRCILFG
jgi:hypothetical protein